MHNVARMKDMMADKAFFRNNEALNASHGTLVEYVKAVQRAGQEYGKAQWNGFCLGYFRGSSTPHARDPRSVEPEELRKFLWELERHGCWNDDPVGFSSLAPPPSPASSYLSKGSDKGSKGSKGQGKQRDATVLGALPGDWYCSSCGAHNYKKNQMCYRCQRGSRPPPSKRVSG